MNTFHISKCDGIHRQHNIPILKLANRIKHDTIDALVFDEYGGRHLLRFLRGHDKNHRTKDNGQSHRLQYVSLAYHHVAKVHFFFHYSQKSAFRAKTARQKSAFRATETSRSRVKPATVVLYFALLRNRPTAAGGLWFALSAYLFLALHDILTLIPARKQVACLRHAGPRTLSAHPTLRPNGLMWGY